MAPPAFGSAPLALLFENGMATEGQMEEEMGAGRGQGAAVRPELWGSAGGTEVVCVQGVRGLGSVLPSSAYGTVCCLLSLSCPQPQWQLRCLEGIRVRLWLPLSSSNEEAGVLCWAVCAGSGL